MKVNSIGSDADEFQYNSKKPKDNRKMYMPYRDKHRGRVNHQQSQQSSSLNYTIDNGDQLSVNFRKNIFVTK